jgi:hypothetical protein
MNEPTCAACGRPVSVCAADPEGCAPAISDEAMQEALAIAAHYGLEGGMLPGDIAAALQRHMDETTDALARSEFYRGMADGRAERMAALTAEITVWERENRSDSTYALRDILHKYD